MGACREILRETLDMLRRVDPRGASERGAKFPTLFMGIILLS